MGSGIMKGMGIREPLAALQQLPVSPESHLNISTLLSAHGHWGTQLSPFSPPCQLLTQAPSGTGGEELAKTFKTLRYLTGLFPLLQGYFNLSGY